MRRLDGPALAVSGRRWADPRRRFRGGDSLSVGSIGLARLGTARSDRLRIGHTWDTGTPSTAGGTHAEVDQTDQ